jgi:hypothetical protein
MLPTFNIFVFLIFNSSNTKVWPYLWYQGWDSPSCTCRLFYFKKLQRLTKTVEFYRLVNFTLVYSIAILLLKLISNCSKGSKFDIATKFPSFGGGGGSADPLDPLCDTSYIKKGVLHQRWVYWSRLMNLMIILERVFFVKYPMWINVYYYTIEFYLFCWICI